MKAIKFRAWNEEERKYIYFDKEDIMQGYGIEYGFDISIPDADWEPFTGLYDKNGKEIYEGDILLDPSCEEPLLVEYALNVAGYVGWGNDRRCGCYNINDEVNEIIGNIHENPELIEVKQ